jgi:hypothetical protein
MLVYRTVKPMFSYFIYFGVRALSRGGVQSLLFAYLDECTLKIFLFVLAMWISAVGLLLQYWRIWWTAVKTGRWLLGGGRSYYFPSKYYTFSLYDRTSDPWMYRLAITVLPILLCGWLLICLLLTILLVP